MGKILKKIKGKIPKKVKFTTEQLKKLDVGYNAYMDILDKKKEFKKALKTAKEDEKATLEDKISRLETILSLATRQKVDEFKELAKEYDKLYPDDFNE